MGKILRQIPTEILLKDCQDNQKQGQSKKLAQMREAQRDIATKCNVVFWVEFKNRKTTLKSKEIQIKHGLQLITIYQHWFINVTNVPR